MTGAFGNAACRKNLKVHSCRVSRLLTDLAIGRGDGSYNRLLNDLKKPDLLILDDFGMASLDPGACRDLLEVVDDRHGKKSIAISAQLPVPKRHDVFEDATIADAVLDRLVNNAHRIELKGPSLRPHQPQNNGIVAQPNNLCYTPCMRCRPLADKIRTLAGYCRNGVRIF